jgi:hypothetical protein
MGRSIKVLGLLFAFILFLSITIKERPVFSYIYEILSPISVPAQKHLSLILHDTMVSTQEFSRKLFNNSIPRAKDTVNSKLSSNKKFDVEKNLDAASDEDRAQLEALIKNHQKK